MTNQNNRLIDPNFDDELFLPVAVRPARDGLSNLERSGDHGKLSLPANVRHSSHDNVIEIHVAAGARHRRRAPLSNLPKKTELEETINNQSKELSLRNAQIADLCNIRQQLDAELQASRALVCTLEKSNAKLQRALQQQNSDFVAAEQASIQANSENDMLRARLEHLEKESAATLKRSLSIATAFNNREAMMSSMQDRIDSLRQQLSEKTSEIDRLHVTMQEERQKHRQELQWQRWRFSTLELKLAERKSGLKDITDLQLRVIDRNNDLTAKIAELEMKKKAAENMVAHQSQFIDFLQLKIEVGK